MTDAPPADGATVLDEDREAVTPDSERLFGELGVCVYPNSRAMCGAAAAWVASCVTEGIRARGEANLILATGRSQVEFIEALVPAVPDWERVNVFHQDEYVGLSETEPASFRRWLHERVVGRASPKAWFPIDGAAPSPGQEAARYADLLGRFRPDVCVLGIGENGHIAFNDPPADFATEMLVHVVELDESSKRQQVGEGHFPSVKAVPERAISLTVRGALVARHIAVVVPEYRKALAVRCALQSPISQLCPASVLRTAGHARLFLDRRSAALLDPDAGQPAALSTPVVPEGR